MKILERDVCILGAGPGGAGAALQLSNIGIPCTLIDKAVFPRDKICGDALSGKVSSILNRIDPSIIENFKSEDQMQVDSWGIRFTAPNLKSLDVPFLLNFDRSKDTPPGFIAKRLDFDNYLVEQVKKRDTIEFFEDTEIKTFEELEDGITLINKAQDLTIKAKMLLVADGAQSKFARHHAGIEMELNHHSAGLRAYYKNVKHMDKNNFIELIFLKELLPGYFWIFPLPNGNANVGLGMLSKTVSKKKLNLKKIMLELIETHPYLKDRFEHAEMVDKIRGYGLPLGSKKRSISGDRYMLLGDAGSLIDPFSGEGIGNALYCGYYAANHVKKCFDANDFSAKFMKGYDKDIQRVMGQELSLSRKMQMALKFPWLFNLVVNIANKNRRLSETLTAMFMDMDLREELVKPSFYFKLIFNR